MTKMAKRILSLGFFLSAACVWAADGAQSPSDSPAPIVIPTLVPGSVSDCTLERLNALAQDVISRAKVRVEEPGIANVEINAHSGTADDPARAFFRLFDKTFTYQYDISLACADGTVTYEWWWSRPPMAPVPLMQDLSAFTISPASALERVSRHLPEARFTWLSMDRTSDGKDHSYYFSPRSLETQPSVVMDAQNGRMWLWRHESKNGELREIPDRIIEPDGTEVKTESPQLPLPSQAKMAAGAEALKSSLER